MSVQLLDKTRKINKLLHNNHSHRVEFNDICAVLSGILESNILVISKKGKVLGTGFYNSEEVIDELIYDKVGGFVDNMLNERLLSVLSTKENVNLATLGFTNENVKKFQALLAPIEIAGERLGTLFMYKSNNSYEIDDIILCEYGTTVVGLEMTRSLPNLHGTATSSISARRMTKCHMSRLWPQRDRSDGYDARRYRSGKSQRLERAEAAAVRVDRADP